MHEIDPKCSPAERTSLDPDHLPSPVQLSGHWALGLGLFGGFGGGREPWPVLGLVGEAWCLGTLSMSLSNGLNSCPNCPIHPPRCPCPTMIPPMSCLIALNRRHQDSRSRKAPPQRAMTATMLPQSTDKRKNRRAPNSYGPTEQRSMTGIIYIHMSRLYPYQI